MSDRIKIIIVDDHPLVLCGLRNTLESADFEVHGTAGKPAQLFDLLSESTCDVVICDYSMPGDDAQDGWRFLAALSSQYPHLPILVYSEFDDPFLVGALVQRRIAGFVSKREDMSEVLKAVRLLAAGKRYFSPKAHVALERFGEHPELRRFTALTPRQMEVTGLMLSGLTVCETARLLDRRMNTVSAQRTEACKRLGFAGESEVYRFAAGHGLWLDRSSSMVELKAE